MRFCFACLLLLSVAAFAHAQSDVFNSEQFTMYDNDFAKYKLLKPASTHVCTLSQLYGRAPTGRVYVGADGYWQIQRLAPPLSGVVVSARCYELAAFTYQHGGANTVRWVSENFSVGTNGSCAAVSQTTWWSDAATILQGIESNRDVLDNRFAFVAQEGSYAFRPSRLYAHGCSTAAYTYPYAYGYVNAYASSFFVGIPHSGHMAKFQGPLGVGTAAQAGGFYIEAETSPSDLVGRSVTTTMAPVNDAMCYLTYISGQFGPNNNVSIRAFNDHWVLQAWVGALSHAGSVQAWAMCMLRNQH